MFLCTAVPEHIKYMHNMNLINKLIDLIFLVNLLIRHLVFKGVGGGNQKHYHSGLFCLSDQGGIPIQGTGPIMTNSKAYFF